MAYERNRYAGMNRPNHPSMFAQWVDPVLSSTGAVIGAFMGAPGGPAGMAAGASAGYKAGHALGDTAEGVANKDLSVGRVVGNARDAYGNASAMNDYTRISPQGGGTQPQLPDPFADPSQAGMQWNPYTQRQPWGQYAFAEGGPVPEQEQVDEYGNPIAPQGQPDPQRAMSMLTPDMIAQIQQHAQTLVGQAPGYPTVENGGLGQTRQASHPTLEALAGLMPTLLGSLPKPANPKNTKAIGAWAPFAGNALAVPAAIAQSRRKAANAPIEDANEQRMKDYEARQKAYEEQKKAYGTALIQGAMRPQAQAKPGEQPISLERAKSMGHPEWAGMTETDVRLKMAGEPPREKGPTPTDPIKFRQYVRIRLNQDPNIKPFIKVRDAFNVIDRISRNATAASDMSMIFAYMKLLDPESVVRESEYANAANARGVDDSIRVLWNGLRDGQKLSPAQREQFRREAMSIMLSRIGSLRDTVASYQGEAEMAGVDIAPLLTPMQKYLDPAYENTLTNVGRSGAKSATTPMVPTTGTDVSRR